MQVNNVKNQKCEWGIVSLGQIEKFIIRNCRLLAKINLIMNVNCERTQPAITCSKLTRETYQHCGRVFPQNENIIFQYLHILWGISDLRDQSCVVSQTIAHICFF